MRSAKLDLHAFIDRVDQKPHNTAAVGSGFLGCRCGGCAVDTGIVDGKNPKVDGRKLRRRTASRFVEALRLRATDDWPRRRERLGADRYTKARFQSSLRR